MSGIGFGARVSFAATVERITARIQIDEVFDKPLAEIAAGGWFELKSKGRALQIVDAWTQDGGSWALKDPFSWPGERVDGGDEPWMEGVFSLVRRFPCMDIIVGEPVTRSGIYLSTSWRTEGQRRTAQTTRDWAGALEVDELARFEQWRRVPVHWVALDPGGQPGRPTIVSVLPDDVV